MNEIIGKIALNIAFVLYLIHYWPQLWHNQNKAKIQQLSLSFHFLLSVCYLADLSYGFGMHMPWQYRFVSAVGLLCLTIQHWQVWRFYNHSHFILKVYHFSLLFFALVSALSIFCNLPENVYITMGFLAQTSALCYMLPQIVKNYHHRQHHALNLSYLSFNWICFFCDCIAAFALQWPMPSKFGAVFGFCCISILLAQADFPPMKTILKAKSQRL